MNSRERILKAISHQETDRIPRDLGATPVTGINKVAYRNLLEYLGIEYDLEKINFIDSNQQIVEVCEELIDYFRIDTRCIWQRGMGIWGRRIPAFEEIEGGDYYTDVWGVGWKLPPGGLYYDTVDPPLADSPAEIKILEDYPWPDPEDQRENINAGEIALKLHEETESAIVGLSYFSFFWQATYLRGAQQFMMDLSLNRDFAEALMDKILENHFKRNHYFLDKVSDHIDVVGMLGDDFASQKGPLISPSLYREICIPRQRQVIEYVRKYTNAPFFMHQDGVIAEWIEDIIDVEVDILNPIQYSSEGMEDTRKLKELYGDRLTFWGGGIDTQQILHCATPDDVREEVKRRVGDLSPNGGYVFATVHNIQADVPPENIVAMFDALDEFEC